MRVIALIDQRAVTEKILRRLDQWKGTPPLTAARSPPNGTEGLCTRKPWEGVDPIPDYENDFPDCHDPVSRIKLRRLRPVSEVRPDVVAADPYWGDKSVTCGLAPGKTGRRIGAA